MRVLAVSDLHTDYEQNLEWCAQLSDNEYRNDILIVAGDISHKITLLEETLRILKQKFRCVFFVPGNHDLWLEGRAEDGEKFDSIGKLALIKEVCSEIGVKTKAEKVGDVWFVPMLSWYHASWDRQEDWENVPHPRLVMADFKACKWPEGTGQKDTSLAELFDSLNDPELQNLETVLEIERESAFESACPVISFSHFLPRNELIPEKSKLFYKALPKAVGSDYLRKRIEDIKPDIHIFGHTHFSWDCYLDSVRYVQWPLAYPKEQERRRKYGLRNQEQPTEGVVTTTESCDDTANLKPNHSAHPFRSWKPIVVYDSSKGGITECRPTYWCNYYGLQTCKGKGMGIPKEKLSGKGGKVGALSGSVSRPRRSAPSTTKPIAKQFKSSLRL